MSDLLTRLQAANPALGIRPASAPEFERYGRLLTQYDASEIIARGKAIVPSSDKVEYEGSVPALEEPAAFNATITQQVYGGMPMQVGWCYGRNSQMAGLEYHKGTEVVVCLTDVVLLLGDVQDVVFGEEITYDTARVEAFYAPAGTVAECFPWCLHFAPQHVTGEQFATLVYLPRGTNEPLPFAPGRVGESKLLFAVNKWLIAHPRAKDLIDQGAYPGMVGDDIFVTPL